MFHSTVKSNIFETLDLKSSEKISSLIYGNSCYPVVFATVAGHEFQFIHRWERGGNCSEWVLNTHPSGRRYVMEINSCGRDIDAGDRLTAMESLLFEARKDPKNSDQVTLDGIVFDIGKDLAMKEVPKTSISVQQAEVEKIVSDISYNPRYSPFERQDALFRVLDTVLYFIKDLRPDA